MKRSYRISSFVVVSTLILFSACDRMQGSGLKAKVVFKDPPGEKLVKVGKTNITSNGLERFLSKQTTDRFNTDKEFKNKILDRKIGEEVLFQEAVKRGYLGDISVQSEIKKMLIKKMVDEETKKMGNKADPTAEEIQKYYNDNLKFYKAPDRILRSYIYFPAGRNKDAARFNAESVSRKIQIAKGNAAKFAIFQKFWKENKAGIIKEKEFNKRTKPVMKETRDMSKKIFGDKAAEVLWSLSDKNRFSKPVETEDGYVIFFKKRQIDAFEKKLADVEEKIRDEVKYKKKRDFFTKRVEEMKKDYPVKFYGEKLKGTKLDPKA